MFSLTFFIQIGKSDLKRTDRPGILLIIIILHLNGLAVRPLQLVVNPWARLGPNDPLTSDHCMPP